MLMPRKPPKGFRKPHHPDRHGAAKGGNRVVVRRVRYPGSRAGVRDEPADRGGTYRDDPAHQAWRQGLDHDLPGPALTKKPAETRMGSGKGSPEWWVANVKPGRILFEMSFPNEQIAREAMRRAIHKLPMKCRIVTREVGEV